MSFLFNGQAWVRPKSDWALISGLTRSNNRAQRHPGPAPSVRIYFQIWSEPNRKSLALKQNQFFYCIKTKCNAFRITEGALNIITIYLEHNSYRATDFSSNFWQINQDTCNKWININISNFTTSANTSIGSK